MNSSLTLPKKIFINNAFYLLPITVLLYLMFNGFSKDINFAEKEIAGAELNKIAISLLQYTADKNLSSDKVKLERQELLAKRLDFELTLNLTEDALKSKDKESLLLENFNTTINSMETSKDSANVMSTLNDLITYVGDSSNLILDPDLDTYYLMDATIYAVPQLINRLSTVINFLELNSATLSNLPKEDLMKPHGMEEVLKNVDAVRLMGDMDTSIKEDQNFNGANTVLQNELKNKVKKLDELLKSYLADIKKVTLEGSVSFESLQRKHQELSLELHEFQAMAVDTLAVMLQTRVENIKKSRNKALGTGVLVVLAALFISFYITRTIKNDLNALILKLGQNSEDVENTSKKNMDISNELSSAVTEQASSVQEISATTEEISQMTQRNNENVKISMEATNKTVETVASANLLMGELGQTVEDLKIGNDQIIERSNLNSKDFESIVEIMKTIEDKTKIINDIVFQTKLLSFNASVEAARAGEQGKGFSVVAEEVGNLAQMSGKAAQEITDLLDNSLKRVRELTVQADYQIKKVVDQSTSTISTVMEKVRYCQDINNEIHKNSEKINSLIGDVVIASEEQTKGVVEITKAIGSFDVVTDRNSQLANELNNSAKSLNEKSNELKEVITSLSKMTGSSAHLNG